MKIAAHNTEARKPGFAFVPVQDDLIDRLVATAHLHTLRGDQEAANSRLQTSH